jgi:hypothetical protein
VLAWGAENPPIDFGNVMPSTICQIVERLSPPASKWMTLSLSLFPHFFVPASGSLGSMTAILEPFTTSLPLGPFILVALKPKI